jgi:hypothetical protein
MINQLKVFQTFWFIEIAAADRSEIHGEIENIQIFVTIPLKAIILVFSAEC